MNTADFEALLEGAEETDVLEFKEPMEWSISLVKDILAMSNLPDGGRIVIGIEDQTSKRLGIDEQQAASYVLDIMRDKVSNFADPFVEFSSEVVSDYADLKFVVITVSSFGDIPVICKRDGGHNNELRQGEVYYRSKTRRPQSARVEERRT